LSGQSHASAGLVQTLSVSPSLRLSSACLAELALCARPTRRPTWRRPNPRRPGWFHFHCGGRPPIRMIDCKAPRRLVWTATVRHDPCGPQPRARVRPPQAGAQTCCGGGGGGGGGGGRRALNWQTQRQMAELWLLARRLRGAGWA